MRVLRPGPSPVTQWTGLDELIRVASAPQLTGWCQTNILFLKRFFFLLKNRAYVQHYLSFG